MSRMLSGLIIKCLLVLISHLNDMQMTGADEPTFTEICNQQFHHCCKCDLSLRSVVCLSCPLIEALLVPSWTQSISIQHCHMTLLDSANFNASSELEELIFTHNDLEVIHPSTFDKLTRLKRLDLSYNLLGQLPDKLLIHSEDLQSLKLSHNNIEDFQVVSSMLPPTVVLDELQLDHNQFAYANGRIPSTKVLNLSGNRILKVDGNKLYFAVDFPITVDTSVLETLNLAYCRAEIFVNFEFGRLYKGVRSLDLTENSIVTPEGSLISLLMLTNLTHLNLSQSAVPLGLWNWYFHSLLTLNISHSMVDSVTFNQPSQLRLVDVSGNDIVEISGLENLPFLHTLSSSSNQLTEIPKAKSKLESLETLTLDNNQILKVRKNDLSQYPNLRSLSLSGNQMQKFSPVAFGLQSEAKLDELNLRNNNISTFEGLEVLSIGSLNLSGNPIQFIGAFEHFQGLKTLSLRNTRHSANFIDFCHSPFIQSLTELVSLDLANNNLSCLPHFGVYVSQVNLEANQLSTAAVDELLDRINLLPCRDWRINLAHNRMNQFPNTLKTLDLLNVCGTEWNLDLDYSANPFSCNCDMLRSLERLYSSVTLFSLLLGLDNSYNFTPPDTYYCYNAAGQKLPFGQFVQQFDHKCKVETTAVSPALIGLFAAIGLLVFAAFAAVIVTVRFNWIRHKFGQYRYTPLNWGFGYQHSDSSSVSCQYV